MNERKFKVRDIIKIIKGNNKGLLAVIISIEKDFTDITVETEKGHHLYGLNLTDIAYSCGIHPST